MAIGRWHGAVIWVLLASPINSQRCPPHVADWTSQQVGAWIGELELPQYSAQFEEQEITGDVLHDLTDPELEHELRIGDKAHRTAILSQIRQLCRAEPAAPPPEPTAAPSGTEMPDREMQGALLDSTVIKLVDARRLVRAIQVEGSHPSVHPFMKSLTALHEAASNYAEAIEWLHREQSAAQLANLYKRQNGELWRQAAAGQLRLQLGASGEHAVAGWLNVDGVRAAAPDGVEQLYHAFAGNKPKLPLPDGSCELIYASHMLEHLSFYAPATADAMMREMNRLLAPGGRLRLVVPDAAAWIGNYVAGLDVNRPDGGRTRAPFSGGLWDKAMEVYGWWQGPKRSAITRRTELAHLLSFAGGAGGAQVELRADHAMGYDFELLRESLVLAGFSKDRVHRCRFNQSESTPFRQIELQLRIAHHAEFKTDSGILQSMSLYVEVRKEP